MEARKIIFVEGEKEEWKACVFLLRLAGFEVTAIPRADEAINWVRNCHLNGWVHHLFILPGGAGRVGDCGTIRGFLGGMPLFCVDPRGGCLDSGSGSCLAVDKNELLEKVKSTVSSTGRKIPPL